MKKCLFPKCKSNYYAKGYCLKHYYAIILRGGYKKRKCKVSNCNKMIWGESTLCHRHLDRFKKNKPMELTIDCRKGKYNSNWRGGISLYKNKGEYKKNRLIKLKQNNKCEECGKSNVKFQIHHKDFSKTNHNLDNLKVLCLSCHKKLYHRFTSSKFKRQYGYTLHQISKLLKLTMWKTYSLHLRGLLNKKIN